MKPEKILINRFKLINQLRKVKGFEKGGVVPDKQGRLYILHPKEIVIPRNMVKHLPKKFDVLKTRKPT